MWSRGPQPAPTTATVTTGGDALRYGIAIGYESQRLLLVSVVFCMYVHSGAQNARWPQIATRFGQTQPAPTVRHPIHDPVWDGDHVVTG